MKPREKLESPTFYAKPKIFEQDVSHSVFKLKFSFKMRHTLFSSRRFLSRCVALCFQAEAFLGQGFKDFLRGSFISVSKNC